MSSVWRKYQKYSRGRYRNAERDHKRLDVQGLRMVAVLTVFANHLWGWPTGGFVGVDVFFVISGFLITGNLLRSAETTGNVRFRKFYWARARRIIPAATLVLLLTSVASTVVFLPFRSHEIGVDALFAFVFASNWWFAYKGADYFRSSTDIVSPIQHYWSLSIEEQFYFVWPALIFVIGLLVVRRSWSHGHRMVIAGAVMGAIVLVSLAWALIQTAASPAAAYFDTFARVWELGAGALLAIFAGALHRIPAWARPVMSWSGIALISATLFLLRGGSTGFPAPWALLPVAGAAMVIAAGVGGEPRYLAFLRNPVSTYIGDISYSLYLIHWPVIILLAAVMDPGTDYYVATVTVAFALAIASYHGVENPLRRIDRDRINSLGNDIRKRRYKPLRSSQYAAIGAMALLLVALVAAIPRPDTQTGNPDAVVSANDIEPANAPALPPAAAALHKEIVAALQATAWPNLDPSFETVFDGHAEQPDVAECHRDQAVPDPALCSWGSVTAPIRVVLLGDSVAVGYAGVLRQIALNSNGQIRVTSEALSACAFAGDLIERPAMTESCEPRKQHAIDLINTTKPNVVIISNRSSDLRVVGGSNELSPSQWSSSLREEIEKFRVNTGKVVLLAPPPTSLDIRECVSQRSNTPADCVDGVDKEWRDVAAAERDLATSIGGAWVDSRPWFCTGRLCPAFVGTTPTKYDWVHMAYAYGQKINPVVRESMQTAGVF